VAALIACTARRIRSGGAIKMRRVLALLLGILLTVSADAGGLIRLGGSSSGSGGSGFTPQSGFAFSGSTAPGGTMTITSTGSVFGTHPYGSGNPLLWAPMDVDMNGSSLGRISGAGTWVVATNLSWASGCGPSGAGGCAYGGATKGDGVVGGPGEVYQAVAAFDASEWSGWASQNSGNGYYINDPGQQWYVWRQEYHAGFGHLDASSSNSYNSVGNYNYKNIRYFSLYSSGTAEGYPDMYWPVHNQRFAVDSCQTPFCFPGVTNGAPIQYTTTTATGAPDVNGSLSVQQSYDGMTSGSGAYNNWVTAEFYTHANSCTTGPTCYASNSAPDSQFNYWVVGKNGNQPLEQWPVSNYQNSTPGVAWMMVDTGSLQSNGHGTMIRTFALQAVVDGTSGCPACADMPLNAYVNYGPVYVDDCFCHVVVQDSATYLSATAREIQIPATWASGSITMTLRAGAFGNLHGKYLFVIDSSGTAHLIGNFTWLIKEMPMANPANDDYFNARAVA
jgi:hypothetical protein